MESTRRQIGGNDSVLRLMSRWGPSQNRRVPEYNVAKCKECKHKPVAVKYDDPVFDGVQFGTFKVFCAYCGRMGGNSCYYELSEAVKEWNCANE